LTIIELLKLTLFPEFIITEVTPLLLAMVLPLIVPFTSWPFLPTLMEFPLTDAELLVVLALRRPWPTFADPSTDEPTGVRPERASCAQALGTAASTPSAAARTKIFPMRQEPIITTPCILKSTTADRER